jgi:hypothetical protein
MWKNARHFEPVILEESAEAEIQKPQTVMEPIET